MKISDFCAALSLALCPLLTAAAADGPIWPFTLPVYDHIVIVVEENKDYEQIIVNNSSPYINKLATEGVNLTRMFAEEHPSQGNYFWLFSGDNQKVGFEDQVPKGKINASSLGEQLIRKQLSFKGYAEALPAIGSEIDVSPASCAHQCVYARKHVPWISFRNVPSGTTLNSSSNLRFADFPSDYTKLPTVAIVIPNQNHDMHNSVPKDSIPTGDAWLRRNLDRYYQWARMHNSLLIVTFDENDDVTGYQGLTDPAVDPDHDQSRHDRQNRVVTAFAGAYVKPHYSENTPLTHVNILRTIEAMYGLPKSGAQHPNAAVAGISDETIITNPFQAVK
jgi:phosphatidylinositol-3-phosphatase